MNVGYWQLGNVDVFIWIEASKIAGEIGDGLRALWWRQ
jgi:hypothetical protein